MNFSCSNVNYLKNVLKTCLNSYKQGTTINISYDIAYQPKTLKQLRFIFGGLIKAICRCFQSVGYDYPPYVIKEWLYQELGIYNLETLPNGEQFYSKKTLSDMTKNEASEFIEKIIFFIDSSEIFEGFILPPDLRYCWTHNIENSSINNIKNLNLPNFDTDFLIHQSRLTCIRCGVKGGMVYHLKKNMKRDYFSLPMCPKCFNLIDSHGESLLNKDLKSVLNGLNIDDFCKYNYFLYKKYC